MCAFPAPLHESARHCYITWYSRSQDGKIVPIVDKIQRQLPLRKMFWWAGVGCGLAAGLKFYVRTTIWPNTITRHFSPRKISLFLCPYWSCEYNMTIKNCGMLLVELIIHACMVERHEPINQILHRLVAGDRCVIISCIYLQYRRYDLNLMLARWRFGVF